MFEIYNQISYIINVILKKMIMNYECNLNAMAKDLLANIVETPFNREFIEDWRKVAVETDVLPLFNTYDFYE